MSAAAAGSSRRAARGLHEGHDHSLPPIKGHVASYLRAVPSNVSVLNLDEQALSGTLPATLPEHIHMLDLSDNELSGTIPPSIFSPQLRIFRIDLNSHLSGTLPTTLALLGTNTSAGDAWVNNPHDEAHVTLSLSETAVSGTLPTQLGAAAALERLDLLSPPNADSGAISGTLPTELGASTRLAYLRLGGQRFSGTLPSELGAMGELEKLTLLRNRLSGTLPTELALLPSSVGARGDHCLLVFPQIVAFGLAHGFQRCEEVPFWPPELCTDPNAATNRFACPLPDLPGYCAHNITCTPPPSRPPPSWSPPPTPSTPSPSPRPPPQREAPPSSPSSPAASALLTPQMSAAIGVPLVGAVAFFLFVSLVRVVRRWQQGQRGGRARGANMGWQRHDDETGAGLPADQSQVELDEAPAAPPRVF